jgi:hypothetical protein
MDENEIEQPRSEKIKQYQINRAKEYLRGHKSKNGSEDTLECCIIQDLLRIIEGK